MQPIYMRYRQRPPIQLLIFNFRQRPSEMVPRHDILLINDDDDLLSDERACMLGKGRGGREVVSM
jgi:hypothetical protein